ncbi:RagB/SusD family nutrient uptake outer membrane protein [Aureibaculum sp. 2210JD6-5]|uniref:RagB/SusD family nutrient uptake outer membrane protein n=1 Tax=Aureibaculum sp. 2210JD6-5 TaxID=3103957 RepID=UPI002AAD1B54|nr:RagB/SusD family nutrient uptake outer membrane protein [Aureibaculum sp. 2210JD6-5]MDY7396944.1 RagB/SusD family nutrient uptake outer membrane protein [Aureibaculum sp. 2210JD6-5]
MKTIKYINSILIILSLVGLFSCELAQDLDDFEPLYALDADKAITNEATAELALAGVYSGFRQRSGGLGNPQLYFIPSIMSGTFVNNVIFNNGTEFQGYASNIPISSGARTNLGAYTRMYDIVNRANWLIEKVTPLADDNFPTSGRKAEIIAETKALRATANFYLLRIWGQFYDLDSQFGITLRTEPARSAEAFPRNTVAEVYDAIIADLDEAIASAPDLRAKYFTNKTYAKGLKAKVLLYKGAYAEAATLAKEVIDNPDSDFDLATTYGSIFLDHTTPDLFNSSEILFGSKGEPQAGLGIGNYTGASVNPSYVDFASETTTIGNQEIIHDGTRIASTIFDAGFPLGLDTYKYKTSDAADQYEMLYHLRMSEIYLIFAEAQARSTNSVTTEALEALNAVRIRAGATNTGGDGFVTYPETITLPQFLEAVRIEKYVELGAEMGEEWFDLVRYHFVDGFDVTTVKASATDPSKYILPIEASTIEAGGNVVAQNPGY